MTATETKQTITPGPWKVDGDRDQDFGLCIVQESTGGVICQIESTPGYGKADELNAQLIAAAPEMLTALNAANSAFNALVNKHNEMLPEVRDAWTQVGLAIAEAERWASSRAAKSQLAKVESR